jgi:hypothetical protein
MVAHITDIYTRSINDEPVRVVATLSPAATEYAVEKARQWVLEKS